MGWKDSVAAMQRSLAGPQNFGEAFTYAPPSGSPVQVSGIFRDAALVAASPGDIEVISVQPQLDVKLADLPAGLEPRTRKGTWTRAETGQVYEVNRIEPDGEGMLALFLHALPPR